ncbi:Integrin-alpha FG-GAP repeat-containing protein 2 [Orchesella cincta]|uniref:Integrin-alpha FG-GAP repeat-containing protein 2 n=1 Tax=Orchesella cincta TaxID=48709 RepID=A0A1D2MZJ3_ORCCI|nr:Integrin-alpha FG-GAP repeat-containing protein 2 [Orchesella cincta]
MRSLSLVECIEVKFSGKILKDALCLGDCDNDGLSELVVGNTDGELFIYRGDKCICKSNELGTISAIVVGDLLNISKNVTIVITIEGWCHIFDVEYELHVDDIKDDQSSIEASASIAEFRMIQPFHSQRIVCNIKGAKLGDANNDGKNELIVGLTDRVLRTYQWSSELDVEESVQKTEEWQKWEYARSEINDMVYNGQLVALNKWEFANQIGSVTLHYERDKGTCILVGQPGGTVSKISNVTSSGQKESEEVSATEGNEQGQNANNLRSRNPSSSSTFDVEHYSLNLGKIQNPTTSTEVVGNIYPYEAAEADHYAVATLDGTVMLCHEDSFEIITQLETPVLALESLNGSFVIIGWEGETYLVKRTLDPEVENCIIRFNFEESVAAFKVGRYALSQNDHDETTHLKNRNCFVYATFHESIYIYPNQFL